MFKNEQDIHAHTIMNHNNSDESIMIAIVTDSLKNFPNTYKIILPSLHPQNVCVMSGKKIAASNKRANKVMGNLTQKIEKSP